MKNAQYWRTALALLPHPEGGAYRETYRATTLVDTPNGPRSASTAIYFLLEYGNFSAFHRIQSDEAWHFYDGDALSIYEITRDGVLVEHKLGKDIENGESLQIVISAGNWFASRVNNAGGYTLVGCTVAPGFDFVDFEMAERAALQLEYPAHAGIIEELTRV
ncbi:hypothetical protein LX64_02254 [Chitinophaga skermanii]|uniref:DUF985 domain-containing protein n=1 Tax=Chitinophaga skermanii TaxID=331697 RepID=A0A327QLC7_9BACT|nr:cupin domain-containing protein [Chitinophaga skermanii]RAJ05100.1 hypothetical protein LX64_02254 [Chitinophaga skermanii]